MNSNDMSSVYRSKLDGWLAVILLCAMTVSAYGAVDTVLRKPEHWWLATTVSLAIGLLLPLWVLLGTYYVVDRRRRRLLVRSGPFRWQVPAAAITSVEPAFTLKSGPALSLDRLCIAYRPGKSLVISPRDAARFIEEVEELRRMS